MTAKLTKFLSLLDRYEKIMAQTEKASAAATKQQAASVNSTKGMAAAYESVVGSSTRFNTIQQKLTPTVGAANAALAVQRLRLIETANQFQNFSTKIASLRNMMLGFYAVQATKGIISAGAAFSKQEVRIKANTNATIAQMKEVARVAKELNIGSIFDPTEIAEGMFILTKAGESVATTLRLMPSVIDYATIAEVKPAEGAEMLHSILRMYDMDISKAAYVTDILAYAQTKSKLSMDQMYESLKNVGGVAAGFGITLEQTIAHLAAIKDSGVAASKAGTLLMNMYLRMGGATSEKGMKVASKLGINTKDYIDEKGVLQVEAFLTKLKEAGATQAELKDILEIRGMRGAMPMMKWLDDASLANAGITENTEKIRNTFTSFIEGMKNAEGYSRRMAVEYMKGWFGAVENLGSSFQNLKIRMSEILGPVLIPLTKALAGLFGWLSTGSPIILFMISIIVVFTSAMFLLIIPLGLVAGAIGSLILLKTEWAFVITHLTAVTKLCTIAWNTFNAMLFGVPALVVKATKSLWALAMTGLAPVIVKVKAFTVALWANNAALLTNPIVILIVWLSIMVIWFVRCYQRVGSVTGAFKQMGATILFYVVRPIQMLLNGLGALFTMLGADTIGAAFKGWGSGMNDIVSSMRNLKDMDVRPSSTSSLEVNTAGKQPVVNMTDNRPVNVNVTNLYDKASGQINTSIQSGMGYTGI